MDTLTIILAVFPSVLSCALSIFYAYLQYKKSKEPPKDEVWETATKMICAKGGNLDSDDFAELYSELKFFKDHPNCIYDHTTIRFAMKAMQKEPEEE